MIKLENAKNQIAKLPIMLRMKEVFPTDGEMYLVGGTVRDILLGKNTKDYDFATPLGPYEVMRRLSSHNILHWDVGLRFGTVGAYLVEAEENVDITTFRIEEYTKGNRKPEVQFVDNLRKDLARRDFTINAMAFSVASGEFFDYFGGIDDLERGVIKAVGNAEDRFSEDPHRIMRAYRFAMALKFSIEDETLKATRTKARSIFSVSHERWKMEMDKILVNYSALDKGEMLDFFNLSVGALILPEVAALRHITQEGMWHEGETALEHTLRALGHAAEEPEARWAALLHDIGKISTKTIEVVRTTNDCSEISHFYGHAEVGAMITDGIADRFRFSSYEKDYVTMLIRHHMEPSLMVYGKRKYTTKAVRRLVNRVHPYVYDLIDLSIADVSGHKHHRPVDVDELNMMKWEIETLDIEDGLKLPSGLGNAIMEEFDIREGPEVGRKMMAAKKAVVDGELKNDADIKNIIEYLKKEE